MCSTARVMSVVATAKATVPATSATTAHSGRWAGAAVAGGGGGTGVPEGSGRSPPGAAAARPTAGARRTASPLSDVSVRWVRGMPRAAGRGCDGAGRWFIRMTHSAVWAAVLWWLVLGTGSATRGEWNRLGAGLEPRLGTEVDLGEARWWNGRKLLVQ